MLKSLLDYFRSNQSQEEACEAENSSLTSISDSNTVDLIQLDSDRDHDTQVKQTLFLLLLKAILTS